MPADSSSRSFATLTHARVRAEQGDLAGALRILRAILAVEPDQTEALRLIARLSDAAAAAVRGAAAPRPKEERVRTLSDWHDRIRSRRGERRVR